MAKRRQGFDKPETPLYGMGLRDPRKSYVNMLRIRKLKYGMWRMFPSWGMHWTGNIKLRDLLEIHEHGAIILRQTKNGQIAIKIWPRPALTMAYDTYLAKMQKKATSVIVKNAVTSYIDRNNDRMIKIFNDYSKRLSEIEE
jgi:hypothetical protein